MQLTLTQKAANHLDDAIEHSEFYHFAQEHLDAARAMPAGDVRRKRMLFLLDGIVETMIRLLTESNLSVPTHDVGKNRYFSQDIVRRLVAESVLDRIISESGALSKLGVKPMTFFNLLERVDPCQRRWADGMDVYEEWLLKGTPGETLWDYVHRVGGLSNAPVRYLDAPELQKRRVKVDRGLLKKNGKLLDSCHMFANPFGRGWALCVIDDEWCMYAGKSYSLTKGWEDHYYRDVDGDWSASVMPYLKSDKWAGSSPLAKQHSSFKSGKPVAFAGCMVAKQGRPILVCPKTGHYRSGIREMFRLVSWIRAHHVDVSRCMVQMSFRTGVYDFADIGDPKAKPLPWAVVENRLADVHPANRPASPPWVDPTMFRDEEFSTCPCDWRQADLSACVGAASLITPELNKNVATVGVPKGADATTLGLSAPPGAQPPVSYVTSRFSAKGKSPSGPRRPPPPNHRPPPPRKGPRGLRPPSHPPPPVPTRPAPAPRARGKTSKLPKSLSGASVPGINAKKKKKKRSGLGLFKKKKR